MYEALMGRLLRERLTDDTRENLDILRDTNVSQKSRAAAHAALDEDADIDSFNINLFTHVETSHMADYWRAFLSMTDALMQNVHAVHICNWDDYVSSLSAMLP